MSMLVLTLITGVGLGALYFLVASGLSLIYGLMHVLNFAHGAFLTLSAFIGWLVAQALGTASWGSFLLSIVVGALVGAAFATLTELVLIRPLYERHIEQVLVTVGLSFAAVALFEGIWGTDPINIAGPPWLKQTTEVLGARIPNTYWVLMIAAALVLAALVLFLQKTRYGMIIRAGVENRSMVTALGIDVRRSFTLVFAIGGAAAGIGGVLAMHYTTFVSAHLGSTLLIFAFIVTVIGGLGSLTGAAIASVLVAVLQQFANSYLSGTGDFIVVILLALVLLVRPSGILGEEGMMRRWAPVVVGVALVVLMAVLPLLNLSLPGILPTPTYMPGTLALLSLCMVFAALALSYNLLLGSAGMLSFGHALYFGAGAYGLGIVLEHFGVPLFPGIFVALIGGMIIAFLTGAVAMRVSGIPFAMVTLAFAQAGSVMVRRNSAHHRRRGGAGAGYGAGARLAHRRRQHAQPVLVHARRAGDRLSRRPVGRHIAPGASRPRDPGERAARARAGTSSVQREAHGVRDRRGARQPRRSRLHAAAVGHRAAGGVGRPDHHHPRHGRARWRRASAGVPSWEACCTHCSISASPCWPARRRSRAFPTSCASRCRSRCSCSACCSSWS